MPLPLEAVTVVFPQVELIAKVMGDKFPATSPAPVTFLMIWMPPLAGVLATQYQLFVTVTVWVALVTVMALEGEKLGASHCGL